MGIKQSAQVETPELNLAQWEYLPQQSEPAIEYGVFRTLRNKKNGELIDQYCIIWPNQQEYEYYLKSFNWRYKQPNIVNTRFICLNNTQSLCSRSFMAKIYIEHIRTRISQISDIPYPDNLYVLMESLEGYSNIFHHSKYFEIEQNQICVDQHGNMKIWVNSDLSVNYPNNQGYNDYHRKGEEDMVDAVINVIAANTDIDTEPSPTFIQFYQQKKGLRGKNFEQAKVLVLNYARLNDTEIPDKFEAIVNMDKEDMQYNEEYEHNQYEDHKSYQSRPRQNQYQNQPINHQYGYNNQQQPLIHTYSFAPNQQPFVQNQPPFIPTSYYLPYQHHQTQPQMIPHYPIYQQNLPQPIYYMPNPPVPRQIYSDSLNNRHNIPSLANTQKDANVQQILTPPLLNRNTKRSLQSEHEPNQKQMKETLINNLQQQLQDQYHLSNDQQQRQSQKDQETIVNNNNHLGQSMSEADGLVSRSLPIKGGSVPQNNQNLSSMGQGIYSHINTKDLNKNNKDGFGLTKNSQLKLKESIKQSSTFNKSNKKVEKQKKSIKYFYSLNEELQIDPDIAADLLKYLP